MNTTFSDDQTMKLWYNFKKNEYTEDGFEYTKENMNKCFFSEFYELDTPQEIRKKICEECGLAILNDNLHLTKKRHQHLVRGMIVQLKKGQPWFLFEF